MALSYDQISAITQKKFIQGADGSVIAPAAGIQTDKADTDSPSFGMGDLYGPDPTETMGDIQV